jgi:hypothetical protein
MEDRLAAARVGKPLIKVPLASSLKVGDWVWDGMTEAAAQILEVAKVVDKIRVKARRYLGPEDLMGRTPLPAVYDEDYVPDESDCRVMWYPYPGDVWFFCPPIVPDMALVLQDGRYYAFYDGELYDKVFDTLEDATAWLRSDPNTWWDQPGPPRWDQSQ